MGSTMIKLQLINLGRWTTQRWVTKQNFPNDPAETQIGSQKIIPPCDLSEALSTCDENYDVANSSYALMELLSLIMRVICSAQYERLTLVITLTPTQKFQFQWYAYLKNWAWLKNLGRFNIVHIFRPCYHLLIGKESGFNGIFSAN